jgi:hypothetical protein
MIDDIVPAVTKMQVQGNHTKIDKCIQINGRE